MVKRQGFQAGNTFKWNDLDKQTGESICVLSEKYPYAIMKTTRQGKKYVVPLSPFPSLLFRKTTITILYRFQLVQPDNKRACEFIQMI